MKNWAGEGLDKNLLKADFPPRAEELGVGGGAVVVRPDEVASQRPQLLRGKVRWLTTIIRPHHYLLPVARMRAVFISRLTEQMGLRSFFCPAAGTRLQKKNPGVGVLLRRKNGKLAAEAGSGDRPEAAVSA